MPTLEAMLSVALAGFALSATPGPSMLYVLSRTVGQSRAAGFASALGLCLGGILLAIATALGLATVFATFDWLVTVLRYLGAAYLIWLGSAMIWGARVQAQADLAVTEVKQNSILAIHMARRSGRAFESQNRVVFRAVFAAVCWPEQRPARSRQRRHRAADPGCPRALDRGAL